MDYFVTICKAYNPETSLVPGPINPHLSLLLPFALQHSILLESMVAVCRASILLSLGRPILEDRACIQHRGNAIAGLNTKIRSSECTDDAALLTVTMLMTLEYLTGNQRGVNMHCKGLDRMLQLRGPISEDGDESDWKKFVTLGLTAYKALGSFMTGQPPEIPSDSFGYLKETFEELTLDKPLSYPGTPFSPDLCIILSRLPVGFSELCLKSQISVQMINILASISAAAATLSTKKGLLDEVCASPVRDQQDHRQGERQQILIQTLLSSLQRMSLTSTLPVEHGLTYGLTSYVFQLRGLSPLNLFYDPILRNFILQLSFHSKPSTLEEQRCLIWTSITVAGALALRAVPMPGSHAVMEHALELYSEARDWSQLEKILRSFFWTEEIGAHWKGVWETAMQRRQIIVSRELRGAKELAVLDLPDVYSEAVLEHIKGAPKAMREMSQAMGICPFRPRAPKEQLH